MYKCCLQKDNVENQSIGIEYAKHCVFLQIIDGNRQQLYTVQGAKQ